MSERWRFVFKWAPRFGHPLFEYSVVGAKGGLHLHIHDYGEDFEKNHGHRYAGGLEVHYRTPPDYMRDQPPSHDKCWLIHGPCWHDGTSLYVIEHVIPIWQHKPFDMEYWQSWLCAEADERFGYSDQPEAEIP